MVFNKSKFAPLDPDEVLADSVSNLSVRIGHEGKLEQPLKRFYSVLFLFLVAGGIFYLLFKAVFLEVKGGEAFFLASQENRFLVRDLLPARGIIYDRKGAVIAENSPSFGLVFDRGEFFKKRQDPTFLFRNLSSLLGKPPDFLGGAATLLNLSPDNLLPRVIVAEDLSLEQTVYLISHPEEFPGMQIFEGYKRLYQNSYANAHLVGFVGKVSEDELKRNDRLRYEDSIGKNGLEAFYDDILRGQSGRKIVEVDSLGRETRYRLTEETKEGAALLLNIDADLQRVAYDTLERYTGLS